MRGMKRLVFRILYILGLPSLLRFFHRHSLTIVLYHGVAPHTGNGIYNYRGKFISPEHFEQQLAFIGAHYRVVPLTTALEQLRDGSLQPYSLAITFDDGYRNFAEYAYPLLSKHRMPATMFLATDFVFRSVPLWVDRLEYAIGLDEGSHAEKTTRDAEIREKFKGLDPALREHDLRNVEQISFTKFEDFADDRAVYAPLDIASMQEMQAGTIDFGAHTQTHPILSKMAPEEQRREIQGSREDISNAGLRVSAVFAYPNGRRADWNEATVEVLKSAGFTHALTTIEGFNTKTTPPYELRRIVLDATEDFAVFANVVSGVRLLLQSFL
jgi:peptidoglycan/xylan/chitin deacetylase (PgdA/CDA1 family)